MGANSFRSLLYKTVHKTLSELVTYTPPTGAPIPNVSARLLRGNEVFGDLDREGYAEVSQDVVRIVFQSDEITPVEKAVVVFENGSSYRIKFIRPSENDHEIVTEVVQVSP